MQWLRRLAPGSSAISCWTVTNPVSNWMMYLIQWFKEEVAGRTWETSWCVPIEFLEESGILWGTLKGFTSVQEAVGFMEDISGTLSIRFPGLKWYPQSKYLWKNSSGETNHQSQKDEKKRSRKPGFKRAELSYRPLLWSWDNDSECLSYSAILSHSTLWPGNSQQACSAVLKHPW